MQTEENICRYCHLPLNGRQDKLYHSHCKIKHNNLQRKIREVLHSRYLSPIKINYSILYYFVEEKQKREISAETLEDLGYDFSVVNRFRQIEEYVFGYVFDYFIIYPISDTVYVFQTTEQEDVIQKKEGTCR
ncbi:MAG: hypothetical protein BGO70_03475 [Bacteroidetes bacterium 43-93]|nr:MAG: hypothetical protein BGO70_03475 [Bacteroidetes bacterium 43-93]